MFISEKETATVCNDESSELVIEIHSEIQKETIYCNTNFGCLGKENNCLCLANSLRKFKNSLCKLFQCRMYVPYELRKYNHL